MPKEIAKQWRRAGAVRIQDADYLQVLSTTDKPEVSGPLAIEMRLLPPEQRAWIREELSRIENEEINNLEVAKCLQVAKEFDEFLAAKFPTVKRYGLEGSETILLWFDTIIKEIENTHLVIGMTHRGRNNLLVCLLGLQAEEGFIFFSIAILRVVRAFPTFISKIKWLSSEFPLSVLYPTKGLLEPYRNHKST